MSNQIKKGLRVNTAFGTGTVTGERCVTAWNIRHEVKLDAPENWSLHGVSNTSPFFWPKEITVVQ